MGRERLRQVMWLLSLSIGLISVSNELEAEPTFITAQTPAANLSRQRALNLEDRQDITSYQSSYYPYPAATGPYPPPSYGPPISGIPQGSVQIEFAFDEIVLRCVAQEPFEHIVWNRYKCPQQFLFGGEGIHVADGSNVFQDDLYDVHIRGHDGTIISELLIKQPLADNSEGIYQCEVWPHIHGGGGNSGYYGYGYQSYTPPKSDIFIIGGSSLLENCYRVSGVYGHQTNKAPGINSKQDLNNLKEVKLKQNLPGIKPRRNHTIESRKDSNSKQLRYNLRYVDNNIYNAEGANVTEDFFRPSKSVPFDLDKLHNISKISSEQPLNNVTKPFLQYTGRSNDKFIEIIPKPKVRKGRTPSLFINSSEITKQ